MDMYYWNENDKSKLYSLWYDIFKDSKAFCDYYFTQKLIDNKVLVIQKEDEIVSQIHMNPYKLSLSNREINSYYIVGVSTKEPYRGNGFAKELILKSINDLYDEKCEFTYLLTVDENIYNRYNFRYISQCFEGKLTNTKTKIPLTNSPIVLNPSMFKEFSDYYTKKMKNQYDGYILRDSYYLARIIKEMACENGTIQLFYRDGAICGYIMLYIFDDTIQIREMVYDINGLSDIISYLQDIMMDKIISFIFPCDFNLVHIFQNYFVANFELKPYMMARLVYIKSFLQSIKANAPVSFNIQVIDSIIKQNNKTFIWNISENSSFVNETDLQSDIVIDIGVLTQWLCGYHTIDELIALNKIEIKNSTIISFLKEIKNYNFVSINEVV